MLTSIKIFKVGQKVPPVTATRQRKPCVRFNLPTKVLEKQPLDGTTVWGEGMDINWKNLVSRSGKALERKGKTFSSKK